MKTLIVAMLCTLTACTALANPSQQPAQSSIETIVAGTMQALTQSAPQGVNVAFENISLVIPTGLGAGGDMRKTDEIEYPPCANPSCVYPLTVMPQHIVFTINGYPLAREARVAVFKASEYANISESMNADISELQSLKSRPETIPDTLTLPFAARVQAMTFQGGYGFRYLTQLNDGPTPINNENLFYYFQGLTDDDAYFVMAVLPISAPFLAADGNPASPLPNGAVPFGWENLGDFDLGKYYETVAQQLNAAAPETFFPDFNEIEALIQSLQMTSP